MNAVVAGLIMTSKVEAIILKITDPLPHSFVLRSVERRYDAWHVVSHSHLSVAGEFYRVAVLAPFEASSSLPVFATRTIPVTGTLLKVLTMDEYMESRK